MKRITIDRWSGTEEVSREAWKDLISALVLVGYEVYGDEGKIVFELGDGDTIEEEENEFFNC
jgi:hypothetical protein